VISGDPSEVILENRAFLQQSYHAWQIVPLTSAFERTVVVCMAMNSDLLVLQRAKGGVRK
jgi:hypothetical protein